mgnify:CR=1 FL=1
MVTEMDNTESIPGFMYPKISEKYCSNLRINFKLFWQMIWIVSSMIILFVSQEARAQCANPSNTSCEVYNICFNRYCPCSGSSNYFISYGRKYCDRFLNTGALSAVGRQWRDKTLRCLQETIIPKLPIDAPATCNCAQMKEFAFTSHVACYTQSAASVCKLPLSDWAEIVRIIDRADLFDSYGASQILEIIKVCAVNYSTEVGSDVKEKWNQAKNTLEKYINK